MEEQTGQFEVQQNLQSTGNEGGVIKSTFLPQIKLEIPEGALTKTIDAGVEVKIIEPELIKKHLGCPDAVSPIVTIQPFRRKLHKPIFLTVPFPKDLSSVRVLRSITATYEPGPIKWEDITGDGPIRVIGDCLQISTTVSARFWFMECKPLDAERIANALYSESTIPSQKTEPYDLKEDIFNKQLPTDVYSSQEKQSLPESGKEEANVSTSLSFQPSTASEADESRCSPGYKTVVLERRSDGLGFSVAGGLNQHDIVPIIVEEIFVGGVAAEDGGLKRGDQILTVNGECLDGLTYQAAVTILKHARSKVTLTVHSC